MIPLRLKVERPPVDAPLVVRLRDAEATPGPFDARLMREAEGWIDYDMHGLGLRVHGARAEEIENDVLLLLPGRDIAHRLIRARSSHNTFLVTERCDQLCVMCSQPPKARDVDLFDSFAEAAMLAPQGAWIGISGGEPTLHRERLFDMLETVVAARPDLRFHVLTNAQHFEADDVPRLRALREHVLWATPLYAASPALHDQLVGKPGAWRRLETTLATLARSGARIELRTVLMAPNAAQMPELARMVATRLPFLETWAIMQLENIGFARRDWARLFFDHGADFDALGEAIDLARLRGVPVTLFNFPLCTLPERFRALAPSTISDWKRRFMAPCDGCSARASCGGFFEWHPQDGAYQRIEPI